MPRLTHKTLLYGTAGALGGSAAWAFILALSHRAAAGIGTEAALGAVTGAFIGAFIWSHEAITGRQFGLAVKRAAYGAGAGIAGGAIGAGLGTLLFSFLGVFAADLGGFRASLGVTIAVALGWTVLGSAIGVSGGLMVRSAFGRPTRSTTDVLLPARGHGWNCGRAGLDSRSVLHLRLRWTWKQAEPGRPRSW